MTTGRINQILVLHLDAPIRWVVEQRGGLGSTDGRDPSLPNDVLAGGTTARHERRRGRCRTSRLQRHDEGSTTRRVSRRGRVSLGCTLQTTGRRPTYVPKRWERFTERGRYRTAARQPASRDHDQKSQRITTQRDYVRVPSCCWC